MAFDKSTRNLLSRMVAACRDRLLDDIRDQLQSKYGLYPDGSNLEVARTERDRQAAADLRDLLEHFVASEAGMQKNRETAAYQRLMREIGFTTLNRMAALRLCEERGIVIECIGKGMESDGFRLYDRMTGGALGNRYQTYQAFLEGLFDEIALELGVLFDRSEPQSHVFPSESALNDVLAQLTDPELDKLGIWQQDETIGWIYQYYNDPKERKAMKNASQTPRNSRELAVRNQFFTPRYVVEFLTDNTLGCIWYEMRSGETRLIDECNYLVTTPEHRENGIPQRQKKDPRDLKILDPACGSGHFLLYAFDLLINIYNEAWEDPDIPPFTETGTWLANDYPDLESLHLALPGLILRHNLYGVDIDSRAVQIAALALWLRTQSEYQLIGLKPAERPVITKTNLVTAEPMPGDSSMLEEFIKNLHPPLIGDLLRVVFEKMKLLGDLGTLLKIEEDLVEAIDGAKSQWLSRPKAEQISLWPDDKRPRINQLPLFDISGITDEKFWITVEEQVIHALNNYAEDSNIMQTTRRRLFSEDTVQGLAFVDLCRNRFDVVLMNPPFGSQSLPSKEYINSRYSTMKEDIDASFVSRGFEFTDRLGLVGAITNRTILYKSTLEDWRKDVCLGTGHLRILADLGLGVLDEALVEAAAYSIGPSKNKRDVFFAYRLMRSENKGEDLLQSITNGQAFGDADQFQPNIEEISKFPASRIAYFASEQQQRWISNYSSLQDFSLDVRQGLATADNFRFIRLRWEVDPNSVGYIWFSFDKGGEYSPYFNDIHLLVNWRNNGKEIRNFYKPNGRLASRPQNIDYFFKQGITYPRRTGSNACFRILPRESIFDAQAPIVTSPKQDYLLAITAILNSRPIASFLELLITSADSVASASAARTYEVGIIKSLPLPRIQSDDVRRLCDYTGELWYQLAYLNILLNEINSYCIGISQKELRNAKSIKELAEGTIEMREECIFNCLSLSYEVGNVVEEKYNVDGETRDIIEGDFGRHPFDLPMESSQLTEFPYLYALSIEKLVDYVAKTYPSSRIVTKKSYLIDRQIELLCLYLNRHPKTIIDERKQLGLIPRNYLEELTQFILSYCLGSCLGHWDVRCSPLDDFASLKFDVFDPLPIIQVGRLMRSTGFPALPNDIVSESWLQARSKSIVMPELVVQDMVIGKDGNEHPASISNSEYPVNIQWDGLLVDDPGVDGIIPNPSDIVLKIQEVLKVLWPENHEEIEAEACEILGVKELREYFRKPKNFFTNHLKLYSKSRRKAPIYWPLSTASGSYTLWIYYQRLDEEILYTAVNRYVEPKIASVERHIAAQERELLNLIGKAASDLKDKMDAAQTFLIELREFRDELLHIAALPYKPNLNDGVIINAAPFHKLFGLSKWAKDTKATWDKLEAGEYDWAHLAYTIWPERVREVCKKDKSIAIAHGLENLYEDETPSIRK